MLPTFIKFLTERSKSPYPDDELCKDNFETEIRTVTTADNESSSIISSVSDPEFGTVFRVKPWDKMTRFADYIADGLRYLKKDDKSVVMLYESPSSANSESTFFNCQVYKFHDYPPASNPYKTMLGPCRYSLMNGTTYPSYLQAGAPPSGLFEHWTEVVPGFERPEFIDHLPTDAQIYAYLPCEAIMNHVNDPYVHYHLAGKDALHLMTKRTTKLLPCTKVERPCVVKTTHSMGSKGIFVVRNDEDEDEFQQFLAESGNPTFVVTEYVEIARNVACHFFIHPSGEVTWFGSNENYREADGNWSMDSYLLMRDQEKLKQMQMPFVKDVVQYCLSLGFWGFCGIDVLFDQNGQGYLVDVNPRVTGSCPSLMVAQLLQDKYGFEYGLFRRNGRITFAGSAEELLSQVSAYNRAQQGSSLIVLFGFWEESPTATKMNIGVYGHSLDECRVVLNRFAQV